MKSSPSSPFIYFLLNWILQLYAFDSAFVQIKLFAFNFIHLKIKMSFKKLFLHSNPKQRFVSVSFLFFTWLWWTIYIFMLYLLYHVYVVWLHKYDQHLFCLSKWLFFTFLQRSRWQRTTQGYYNWRLHHHPWLLYFQSILFPNDHQYQPEFLH